MSHILAGNSLVESGFLRWKSRASKAARKQPAKRWTRTCLNSKPVKREDVTGQQEEAGEG
jgi:hypothetical protein